MKVVLLLLLFHLVFQVHGGSYVPVKIDMESLRQGGHDEKMLQVLSEVGMVQVGMDDFKTVREKLLRASVSCGQVSKLARNYSLADGTVRRTIAYSSMEETPGRTTDQHEGCTEFDELRSLFMETMDELVRVFSHRVGLHLNNTASFLKTWTRTFDSFASIVENGQHLDHFHNYLTPSSSFAFSPSKSIEMHTDQGLFIVFLPPIMVGGDDNTNDIQDPGHFFIETKDGQEHQVAFHEDAVVIMLGDGVNQYINAKSTVQLRATPHAVQMPSTSMGWRSWYGRMILPPMDAVHEDYGVTFGQLREKMIHHVDDKQVLSMGCSSNHFARELVVTDCADNQIYCWHRCMNFTEEVNPEVCEALGNNYTVKCTSQIDQVWLPEHGHGDFNPACSNSTDLVTPSPTIPPPGVLCDEYDPTQDEQTYQGVRRLNSLATLYWNIDGVYVDAKIVLQDTAGWMALGIPGTGGPHEGMNNATIVMGKVDVGGQAGQVDVYRIHPTLSAFRHWNEPLNQDNLVEASLETHGSCFTSMTFKLNQIGETNLTITGTNRLLWAVHTDTWDVGYHGFANRGFLDLDFTQNDNQGSAATQTTTTLFIASFVMTMLLIA